MPTKVSPGHVDLIIDAFDVIELSDSQKLIVKNRFTSLIQEYRARSINYSYAFHGLRVVITIGSLIVPALLSVQFTGNSVQIYWIVWVLSLFVTISNALITLMKIDKKYYMLNTVFHHIVSEGWLYIELSGQYSGFKTPGLEPTHKNQYIFFCQTLEKIRMKHVEDEYFKLSDNNHNKKISDQLIPPTPFKTFNIKSPTEVNDTTVRRNPPTESARLPFGSSRSALSPSARSAQEDEEGEREESSLEIKGSPAGGR